MRFLLTYSPLCIHRSRPVAAEAHRIVHAGRHNDTLSLPPYTQTHTHRHTQAEICGTYRPHLTSGPLLGHAFCALYQHI
ncbi:uncharacterized protein B0I36DRAFT_156582 [Microdochium trichocladiopsis]|uniref:Uncharacterized protein n=1 Tax=Microdochium trichocladiopsis TaxID=1682393 RepID=A0A9P9BMI2_9PEZI|nr:uncharacterized protein B0I36DRAFT_156582 [Microdochium trichocladiopsis]KAH7026305.1 hypothetical protein B0I36DRAFT_156582 [Microdochium trichocladiopsis]